jgi:hypothetical protein
MVNYSCRRTVRNILSNAIGRLTTNFNGYQEPTSNASITSSTHYLGSIWTFDYLLVSSVDLP